MTKSILITGVGGQGIILTARILSEALVDCGYDVKMSEIHGMSQRGGTVNTQLKYGDKVYAPNIGRGEADIILAFEKAEALRALPYLKKGGRLVMDTREIYSMPVLLGQSEYPHDADRMLSRITENVTLVPAGQIAEEMGNIKVQNICLLGALARLLELENIDWEALITRFVPVKLAEMNINAFRRGYNRDYAL